MILIADSGSTKTEWVLLSGKQTVLEVSTRGINPYFLSVDEIASIFKDELLSKFDQVNIADIKNVFYYGAGCSSIEKNAMISEPLTGFFVNATVDVTHDLLAAARAACGAEEGIAVILGTGSNTCLFDGKNIVANQPSLGFILGDEGSGGYIGKELLKQFLYGELPIELHNEFDKQYEITKEIILNKIYKEPMPNTYAASFTKFVAKHIEHTAMQQLVLGAFDEFFKRHISSYKNFTQYPISVIGSIAHVFEKQLKQTAANYGTGIHRIIQKPMEGLISYHTEYVNN
jgi:glucosamine kinase